MSSTKLLKCWRLLLLVTLLTKGDPLVNCCVTSRSNNYIVFWTGILNLWLCNWERRLQSLSSLQHHLYIKSIQASGEPKSKRRRYRRRKRARSIDLLTYAYLHPKVMTACALVTIRAYQLNPLRWCWAPDSPVLISLCKSVSRYMEGT